MEIYRKINGQHVKTSLIYFGEFLDISWNSIKKFEEFVDFDNDNGAIWRWMDENWRVLFAEIAMGGIGDMQPLSASYREAVSGRYQYIVGSPNISNFILMAIGHYDGVFKREPPFSHVKLIDLEMTQYFQKINEIEFYI
ncbi:hypothetical protein P7L74_00720 (plasmid) [Tistrella mobilis]|uniref:hypothetical protein n=1 Tax=Tistrella mobilis TaxID=171437 RepID=UPI003556D746